MISLRIAHSKNTVNKMVAGRLFQDYGNYTLSYNFGLLKVTCLVINISYKMHLHVKPHI